MQIKYVRAMLDVLSVALGVDVDGAVEAGEQNDEVSGNERHYTCMHS